MRAISALAFLLLALAAEGAMAEIANRARAGASHGGVPVGSEPSSQAVPAAPGTPAITIEVEGRIDDDDDVPGLSAGDTVTWIVAVENAGNITLESLSLSAPAVAVACPPRGDSRIVRLAPGARAVCSGRQVVTQDDLDSNGGGDGDIDLSVTASSAQLPEQAASGAVPVSATAAMRVDKSVAAWSRPFPGIYALEYAIEVENTGTVTLNDIRVADDLGAAFGSHERTARPEIFLSGFAGDGGANAGYDGVSDTGMLTGDVRLGPGRRGLVSLRATVEAGPGSVRFDNAALATSRELPVPVASDDPAGSPNVAGEATVFGVEDSDGDGAGDEEESISADRDGDGAPNAFDYDPTGYFYCEADGRILAGGSISVERVGDGRSESDAGADGAIGIVRDGRDGRYQFHVGAPGRYRLDYRPPAAGVPSTRRRAAPALEPAGDARGHPVVLGSGEAGSSGRLGDFSAAANPFHTEFRIETGDPPIFNNNIPFKFCGTAEIAARVRFKAAPLKRADGWSQLGYRVSVTASGNERVDEIRVTDDLAAVFGAGNYRVVSGRIVSAPAEFGATFNPFYDGQDDISLLTSGGDLEAGEAVVVDLDILADIAGGDRTNTVLAEGLAPLDARPIEPSRDEAEASFARPDGTGDIAAAIEADAEIVRPGEALAYEARFRNDAADAIAGVDLVSAMPAGLVYLAGSASVGGVPHEPWVGAGELIWEGIGIGARGTAGLRFDLAAEAGVAQDEFVLRAFARDPASGIILSNIAETRVRRARQAVFDCSEIVGRVFDDRNRDGYRQEGEPGIAGVGVATPTGAVVTSDASGVFRVTCAMIGREAVGSPYSLTLDAETLPDGYRMTSENPGTVRLERGRTVRLNFGAARLRVVTHTLDGGAFQPGTTRLESAALAALADLLNFLEEEKSILRITYPSGANDPLGGARLEGVKTLIESAWESESRPYELSIETEFSQ